MHMRTAKFQTYMHNGTVWSESWFSACSSIDAAVCSKAVIMMSLNHCLLLLSLCGGIFVSGP